MADPPRRAGGSTPLLVAAQNGHAAAASLLLAAGAWTDQADEAGRTPLYAAGLDRGDQIVALGETEIKDQAGWIAALAAADPQENDRVGSSPELVADPCQSPKNSLTRDFMNPPNPPRAPATHHDNTTVVWLLTQVTPGNPRPSA